jgi:hypothetical protein
MGNGRVAPGSLAYNDTRRALANFGISEFLDCVAMM